MKTDAENARSPSVLAHAGCRVHESVRAASTYLRQENRAVREQAGDGRLPFNDDQRRRLAVRASRLGRKLLAEFASLVTLDNLLAWHLTGRLRFTS
jgi:hypothetical protein